MKGQIAVELLAIVGVLIAVLTVFSMMVFERQVVLSDKRFHSDGARLCFVVADEINTALTVGSGYSSSFYVPRTMADAKFFNVTLKPLERRVIISWNGGSDFEQCPIITRNVTGSVVPGDNRVRNSKGVVIID